MIELRVSRVLQCTPARALAVLEDWRRYPEWWPLSVSLDSGALVVRPLPLVRLVLEPAPCASPGQVVFRYTRGPFRGTGTWEVAGEPEGPAKVGYLIQLGPAARAIELVSSTHLFRARHRRDIEGILERLEARAG